MTRPSPRPAFTLIEMLVVMAVIAILTGIILSLNSLVQSNAARNRAIAEIKAIAAACEVYKNDNGGYPQDANTTDKLDPRTSLNPSNYQGSSLFLWQQLTGHADTNPKSTPTGTNYAPDIFKDSMLGGTKDSTTGQITTVSYIMDPFGNSYGYSTIGMKAEQDYKAALIDPSKAGSATRSPKGYNPTFDLWSTGGSTTNQAKWVKNW